MKIIDILNKIANGEEAPYRIKYNGRIYEYVEEIKWYLRDDMKCELTNSKKCLNEEVEILEEEKNIPEKLEEYIHTDSLNYNQCNYMFEKLTNKYNEIIDYLDYLKSKGDE